jgi:hypothetical protein
VNCRQPGHPTGWRAQDGFRDFGGSGRKPRQTGCFLCAVVYYYAHHAVHTRRVTMQYVVGCLLFITGIVAYFPIVYIRKTNKILKILEQIETNTRKS